jgi:hypothetical protein
MKKLLALSLVLYFIFNPIELAIIPEETIFPEEIEENDMDRRN